MKIVNLRLFAPIGFLMALSLQVDAQLPTSSPAAPPAEVAVGSVNSIESLLVTQQGGNTVVKVGMAQPLAAAPSSFSVANPARVVFDFAGTVNGSGRTSQTVNDGELRSINIVQVGDRTRVVLNLKKMGSHQTQIDGSSFLVTLAPTQAGDSVTTVAQHFAGDPKSKDSHFIRDLGFRRGKAGEGLVTVELSDPNTGIDVRQQGMSLLVEFQKVQLPEEIRRRLDVTDFATPVTTVTTTRQGENARVVITAQGLWEHTAYQSDNQFVVEVKPLKEDPTKLFQGSQRQGYQGEKVSLNFQNIPLRELLHVFADITGFNIVISDTVSGNVSLRLNDVPWDQGLDIVLKQKGLAMRKNGNVIWIAPSDELAAREKLDLESQQAIADLEPVRTESFQLNYQKADVVEKMLRGISTAAGSSSSPSASTQTAGKASPRVLSDRGSAIFDQRTNKLFVTDTPRKLTEIRRLILEIDVPVRQVLIEARIVEADDTFSKSLGARLGGSDNKGLTTGHPLFGNSSTRWGVSGTTSDANRLASYYPNNLNNAPQFSQFATNYVPTGRITDITYKDGAIDKITFDRASPDTSQVFKDQQFVNLAAANPAGQFALTLFSKGMAQLLTLEISAMEADGKGKTISSPRILTSDQREATIEDGVEIPYYQATSSGATSIAFRKAVLSLNVTPQITPDGRVMMKLQVNKDNVSAVRGFGDSPAIDTKNVKTDVLIENGGTVVIGGIYVQETRTTVNRVPVLGEMPLLGNLFRKTDKADNRRELLVFVTPKIVADTLSLR